MIVKCKCGVSLFNNDIVETLVVKKKDYAPLKGATSFDQYVWYDVYRCPKCFLTTKRKRE